MHSSHEMNQLRVNNSAAIVKTRRTRPSTTESSGTLNSIESVERSKRRNAPHKSMTSTALLLSVVTLLSGARAVTSCSSYSHCEPFLVVGDAEAQSRAEYVWAAVTFPPPEMPDKEDYQCGNTITLEVEESGSSFSLSTQRKCFCGDASRNPCDPGDLEQTCSCMYSRRPPQTQAPVTVAPSISIEPSSSLAPSPTPPPAGIGPSDVYLDLDEDGTQDSAEFGLPSIDVALHCSQNGGSSNLVANATTDSSGTYAFDDVKPGQSCYVEVMLDNNDTAAGLSFCSPVTEGNFVGYDGKTAAVDVESGESYDWPVALCQTLASIGPSLVFLDSNQDGMFDTSTNSSDLSLEGHKLELYCSRNGRKPTLVATNFTVSSGFYEFNNIEPGECYIQHIADDPSKPIYSPIVDGGGNQADENGQTRSVSLTYGQTQDLSIGFYLQEDTGAVCGQCLDLDENGRHDCGWGVWNDCTCQCDCSPGVCLSANQKCYDGCTTHEDFNPFGGCAPGVDCPWYPSKLGENHCESSQNFAGIYNLRETAELCCKQYFGSQDLTTCIEASEADVLTEEVLVAFKAARPKRYYPDMFAKQNCVFDSDYYDWMASIDNENYFLFSSEKECCDRWYPARSDCPELLVPTTPHQVDYKPDKDAGYFYPHLDASNCRFGRNYPMWMDRSPEHYLYTTPEECCSAWYPRELNCPLAGDDGVQDGEYWVVDFAFYPNWKGDGCAEGSDWPEWMADPTQKEYHLFKTAKECCDMWFPDHTELCQATIVGPTSRRNPEFDFNGGTWYPSLGGDDHDCLEGTPPDWMLQDGYKDHYVFDSHAECCKAHYCAEIRGVVQS